MPSEDRVRADDGGDLAEDSASEKLTLRRQPSSLVVGQPEALAAQLLTEDTILFLQVADDGLLVPIDPTGCRYDQRLPGT